MIDDSARFRSRNVWDVAVVVAMVAAVVGLAAHAPSSTHMYAQLEQIGSTVGLLQEGESWLLPRDHMGGLTRKPQLYGWLTAPLLAASGRFTDFLFRLPTVAATFVTALLLYLLGLRWFGRRAALAAAVLWLTPHHMSKMTYVAVTDMMLTAFLTGSIFYADAVLFHPVQRRGPYVVGFWLTMILGAMSKGWGVVNVVLVGSWLALAAGMDDRLDAGATAQVRGWWGLAKVVLGRWWQAGRRLHAGWGLAAMAAVLVPLMAAMLLLGGKEFLEILDFEFVRRLTGKGANVPDSASLPAVLPFLYYMLPMTIFFGSALVLAPWRRWLAPAGPTGLAMCWVVAIVVPFSLPHGFRPDYLLPAYGAAALLAGWAVDELMRRGGQADRAASRCRTVMFLTAAVMAVISFALGGIFLFHDKLPSAVGKLLAMPHSVSASTAVMLAMVPPVALVALGIGLWGHRRGRLGPVVAALAVASLAVMFLDTHFVARTARSGDGDKMRDFALKAQPLLAGRDFAAMDAKKLSVQLYLGRFGQIVSGAAPPSEIAQPLLITCDRGLNKLRDGHGVEGLQLGRVLLTSEPIDFRRLGRIYLIELSRAN